ncbi:exodeoxyribonuclease VII large subunit [Caenimonas sp. S4]|nr:exodeoxyribonuclease VII large subunit [Caenimonas soli]
MKALGARWDTGARQWYVPAGLEISIFRDWLPAADDRAQNSMDLTPAYGSQAIGQPRGVSLSQLLAGVSKAVADSFDQGVWTRAEVLRVQARDGNVYLELSERDSEGRVLAKAPAAIWARTAGRILPDFERATGAHLAAGIKLLVLAKPVFRAQFGFSLEVTGVDPSYTVGDLEAQKRRIRERLQGEGLFDRNKRLPAPWDFTSVLVVSPEAAAGLGDFAKEAGRLQEAGVCAFTYVHSRFQGPGAVSEILAALREATDAAGAEAFDAVIIIRGGGPVNDLAWLNDYALAKFVCACRVPVLTGIGHERDSTLLDEVAHKSFDTPSKVIAGIEAHIAGRVRQAGEAFDRVLAESLRVIEKVRMRTGKLDSEVRESARNTVDVARRTSERDVGDLRVEAMRQLHEASMANRELIREVQVSARQHVRQARQQTPAAMSSVRELAMARVRAVRSLVESGFPALLAQVNGAVHRGSQEFRHVTRVLMERAEQAIARAQAGTRSLMREIASQGPEKTLSRGFAIVSTLDGKTVTSAGATGRTGDVKVRFGDGTVPMTVKQSNPREKINGGE